MLKKTLLAQLSKEEKELLIGTETDDIWGHAFPRKRVVHPGIRGTAIAPQQVRAVWDELNQRPEHRSAERTAYIHIPFCQSKCLYCGFFQNFSDDSLETLYVDCLIRELAQNEKSRFAADHPINALYFGGGTPSALSTANIVRLFAAVRTYLPLANDCEITFESRLFGFDDDKVAACIAGGATRFSFGVQSFDSAVRKSVGRLDDRDAVLSRLAFITGLGKTVNVVDLIYGLPLQSEQVWQQDLETVASIGLDGADLYKLNVYEQSALRKAIDAGALPPEASTAEQGKMFETGVSAMQRNRFRRLSVCHWGFSRRERNLYNSLNKSGATVLPFGAGAGGNLGGVGVALDRDIRRYMERVGQGEKPIMAMVWPHVDHRLHAAVVAQIEAGYLDVGRLEKEFEIDAAGLLPVLDIWQRRGLVEPDENAVKLTIAGQYWYVNITQSVLEILAAGDASGQIMNRSAMAL